MKNNMIFKKSQNRYTNGTVFGKMEMIHPDFPKFPLATVNVFVEPLSVPCGKPLYTYYVGDSEEDCLKVDVYADFATIENRLSDFDECPIFLVKAYYDDTAEYTLHNGSKHKMVSGEAKTPEDMLAEALIRTAIKQVEIVTEMKAEHSK